MTDPIRPGWLSGLRLVGPAPPSPHLPAGAWIVRHALGSRALAGLASAGHPMYALDEEQTIVGPTLYIPG